MACDNVGRDKVVCVCERKWVAKMMCNKGVCVCETWCVTKLGVTKIYVKDGVWE